jgi:hypothetical protein
MALQVDEEFRGHWSGWERFIKMSLVSAAVLAVALLLLAAAVL